MMSGISYPVNAIRRLRFASKQVRMNTKIS
jgi:hypothetical protein